jgi:hypothetical protein
MAESPKTQPTAADVEAFLAEIPDPGRRADARALAAMLSELTGEEPVMWGPTIVGCGTYRYRNASGREGTTPLAGFSPRKANLAIYLMSGFADTHQDLVEKLGPHKTGKGCLYLKRLDDVDLDVLRELVNRSIQVRRADHAGS